MMGYPVNNLCFKNRGNQSMLSNISIPDSILKKKTVSQSSRAYVITMKIYV